MWLLVLASLLLQLSEGQCGIHQTCVECNVFLSTTGNACKWCAGGGLNVGCVDKGATCPGATSAQTVCPPPLCETAATCGECLGRASPSGGACGWCTTSTKLNIGCRSSSASCVGSTSNKFWLDCSFPSEPVVVPVTFVWPTPFFSLSMGLGLVIGLFVYVRNRNADMSRIVKACYGLFFLSFFLYGAALFSFLLSLHVVSKTSRKCCSCYCFWIWFFGCMEVTSVWVGMLTAAVIDGIIGPNSLPFVGIFSIAIGLPTIYGGLIAMGIPRIAMTTVLSRKKLKNDDEHSNASVQREDERAPLLAREPLTTSAVANAPAPVVAPAPTPTPVSYFPSGAPVYQQQPPPLLYAVSEGEQLYNK